MAKKSVIANLVVTLGANSARLKTEMDKAKDDARKWAKSMKSIASTAGKGFGIALAGAAATGAGFVAMVERQADQLDQLAKKADKLGVGTEALQKLQYQAELTGVSQNTLGTAMQRMTRRVAEAAQGTGEARKAIAELGLDAQALAGMSPDQQFYAIADAMKGISNQGDRLKLAVKVFDTEGAGLVNTFAADLKELGKEFDNLGVAITRPQTAAVEAYNDAKTRLSAVFTGLQQHVTVGVVPAMQILVSKTLEFIDELGGIDQVAESVTIGALSMIQNMVEGFKTLIEIITDVKEIYYAVVSGGQKFGGIVSKGVASLAGTVGLDSLEKEANLLGDSFYKVAEDTEKASQQMLQNAEKYSDRMGSLIENVNQAKEKVVEGFKDRGTENGEGASAESEQVTQWRAEIAALQKQIMASPGQNVAPLIEQMSALQEKITAANDPVVNSTEGNTTATQLNTAALNAAATAMGAQKGAGTNAAWEKIFGTPKDGKKQGDKIDQNFSRAAQEYQKAMANGTTGAAEAAAARMKEIIQSFEKNPFGHSNMNGRGISTGRADEYDVTGMQAVMEKLLGGEGKTMGTININLKKEDGSTESGQVTGSEDFVTRLATTLNNAALAAR